MLLKNKPRTREISVQGRQKGFLLLETLLALTILSVGVIAVVKVYSVSLRAQKHAQYQTSALLLASRLQEEIEIAAIDNLKGGELIGTKLFEWVVDIETVYPEKFKLVRVKVKWDERSKEYEVSFINLYPESFVDKIFDKKINY